MDSKKSLYSFYTDGGIETGLTYEGRKFFLNGKPFQIFSGSLHYFRLHPNSWKESIQKMRHCHLNTVCTYIPWNLHEDKPGVFNFSHNLDLFKFIDLVKAEDMFLILRVGPYICAEIDLGGLPSWLFKSKNMQLRSHNDLYLNAIDKYFDDVIPLIKDYQFSLTGGPIIAFQIENEFGSFGDTEFITDDYQYILHIEKHLRELEIQELLFTCDMPSVSNIKGSIHGILMTANFQTDAKKELTILESMQRNKPLMVAELWSGWFDHWGEKHEEVSVDIYVESLKIILERNASFNIYVFQGGTNFGFSNGANVSFPLPESAYNSTVTSYDYGALLTESGEYTEKYFATLALLKCHRKGYLRPDNVLAIKPTYMNIKNLPVQKFLPLSKMLPLAEKVEKSHPFVMEYIGQTFGFTLYETYFNESGPLWFYMTQGIRIIVFVNSVVIATIEKIQGFHTVNISHTCENTPSKLWMLVENLGRVNFTEKSEILNNERRGIRGPVYLNDIVLNNWTMYVLDFNQKFIQDVGLTEWEEIDSSESTPNVGLYSATFDLTEVEDSYLYSETWNKGIIIVNGFNIGRYWKIGPQQTLYVSKHHFKNGPNEIIAFELHNRLEGFEFKDSPILDVLKLDV